MILLSFSILLIISNFKVQAQSLNAPIFTFEITCQNGDDLYFSSDLQGIQRLLIKNKGTKLIDNVQLELYWKYNQQNDVIDDRSMQVVAKLFDSETPIIKDISSQLDGICRTCVEGNKLLALIGEEIPSLFEIGLLIIHEGLTLNKPAYREMIPTQLQAIIPKTPEIVQKIQYKALMLFKGEIANFFATLSQASDKVQFIDNSQGVYPPRLPLLLSDSSNFYIPWDPMRDNKLLNDNVNVGFQKDIDGLLNTCQLTFGDNGINVKVISSAGSLADLVKQSSIST